MQFRSAPLLVLTIGFLSAFSLFAQEQSQITFNEPLSVKWFVGPAKSDVRDIQVRALLIDGEIKYFTIGEPQNVTDDMFVIRQAYRLDDLRPDEPVERPEWRWQRGGWLVVERASGDVYPLKLPDFDPFHSVAVWKGDMVAYCGLSDDAEKLYGVVAQIGEKKPLNRVALGRAVNLGEPDSECAAPEWTANGVIFRPAGKDETLVKVLLTKDEMDSSRTRLKLPEEFQK
jgi:hypothetical protein